MKKSIIIKGRLTGPRQVELAEAVSPVGADVEVIIPAAEGNGSGVRVPLSEIIQQLPPGNRSKAEIDRQVDEDRDSWDRS